ncbi:ABC transporter permease subunit [Acidimangrovimonas sediminis]|uniref:ABC transporter permease subunit n=1 Tax=Acidimangrovimonas sediminis TaxID=2056283 RepID=UPI000C80D15D|nr:ABC transporter permease subunit [Acidimangrovimonas sediminis]
MSLADPAARRRRPAPGVLRHLSNPAVLLAPAVLFLAFMYITPLIDLIEVSLSGPTVWGYFERVFSVSLYSDALIRTIRISFTVGFLCLFFGYPIALLMHRTQGMTKVLIGAAIILPYFISILIRTYAWMVLLSRNGPINKVLMWLGALDEPAQLLFNRGSVLLGISTVLLPMMVLSIYSSLSRLDPNLNRAGLATGAGPIALFWRVTLPLTLPGIGAGFLLVFVTSIGFFITPTLLGGPGDQMFAMHIAQQAESPTGDGFLQALGVVLLVITLLVVGIAGKFLGFEFIWGGGALNDGAHGPAARPRRRFSVSGLASGAAANRLGWPALRLLGRLPAASGTWTVRLLGGFVIVTLIAPIIVVMIISFSKASYLTFPPPGFSLRWYEEFFSDSQWMGAFVNSVKIACISAVISVTLGTMASIGVVRGRFRAKSAVMLFLVSPIIVPPVVLGLSLYSVFLHLDLVGSLVGLAAAHAICGMPIVIVIIAAALQGVDRRLEQAAAVHGAPVATVFLKVTLPAIAPGMAAAAFFAFLHSFDELILTLFLTSPELKTLPLRLWADVNYEISPILAVVSTLEVLLVIAGIFIARPVLMRGKAA